MFCTMILSEKKFSQILNIFLILIICTIFFRMVSTWVIILFVVFNLIFYKRLHYSKKSLILIALIASPFLLELVFFWNNSVLMDGLKTAEKSVSLLLLPLVILGNRNRIKLHNLLYTYTFVTVLLMLVLFVRFMIISPKFFDVYLKGQELWEVGYKFSASFGMHAPILNMQLSFLTICSSWCVIHFIKKKNKTIAILFLLLAVFSLFFVLFVNTRMALLNTFLGLGIIFFYEVLTKYPLRRVLIILISGVTLIIGILYIYVKGNPYMKVKYFDVTFAHMDKINDLDSFENPEGEVFNSFVTRLSIWNSAWELSKENLLVGLGSSDGEKKLFEYYKNSNQNFLYKYKFPVHNQFLDFTLRFGILGFLVIVTYLLTIAYLGFSTKSAIITSFFFIFTISNLTDDFLNIFHGIVFSGFWISLFACYFLTEDPLYK